MGGHRVLTRQESVFGGPLPDTVPSGAGPARIRRLALLIPEPAVAAPRRLGIAPHLAFPALIACPVEQNPGLGKGGHQATWAIKDVVCCRAGTGWDGIEGMETAYRLSRMRFLGCAPEPAAALCFSPASGAEDTWITRSWLAADSERLGIVRCWCFDDMMFRPGQAHISSPRMAKRVEEGTERVPFRGLGSYSYVRSTPLAKLPEFGRARIPLSDFSVGSAL